jgi:hypothetical protein
VLADALADPANRIAKLLAAEKDDAKVVRELYLAILNRYPDEKELTRDVAALKGNDADFIELKNEKAARKALLDAHEKRLPELQAAWEANVPRTPSWTVIEPKEMRSTGGATFTKQADHSILVSGNKASPDVYTIVAETNLVGVTGVRLEVLADKSLPAMGPGRADNGNFVLSEFAVNFTKLDVKEKPKPAKLGRPQATFSQEGFNIAAAVDNNPSTGWAVAPQFGKNQVAVFEAGNKFGFKEGTKVTFTLSHQFSGKDHNIGRFRISLTTAKPPILLQGATPENIAKLLEIPLEQRTPAQKTTVLTARRSCSTIEPQ